MNNLKRWRLEKMQCSITFEAPIKQKMIDHIDGLAGELEARVIEMLNKDILETQDVDSTGFDHDESAYRQELEARQAEQQLFDSVQDRWAE